MYPGTPCLDECLTFAAASLPRSPPQLWLEEVKRPGWRLAAAGWQPGDNPPSEGLRGTLRVGTPCSRAGTCLPPSLRQSQSCNRRTEATRWPSRTTRKARRISGRGHPAFRPTVQSDGEAEEHGWSCKLPKTKICYLCYQCP